MIILHKEPQDPDVALRAYSNHDPRLVGLPFEFKQINKQRKKNYQDSSNNDKQTENSPTW